MFNKLVTHEFWTILTLGFLLEEGLCSEGTVPFGVPRWGRGSLSALVTDYRSDAPKTLYQEPEPVRL